ncbi:MAG: D-2-hydroxyacid dehydrogenase [Bacteroidaceae bacterium]|nr:D-2-hydroxyacid dehydrogenase [Bacteroidaceae bacterium]
MKIVILDAHTVNPGDLSWHQLESLGELKVYARTNPDEVVERCTGAEAVLTNKVVLDADILNQLPRLEYIGVLATGYNVVDLEAATRQSIVVTNIPAYSTQSVAQMVWAHILNIVNRVDYYARANRDGRWSKSADFCYFDFPHTELAGKTIGIIGLGNIGMAVAHIALAFGMKVVAYTSKSSLPDGIRSVSIDSVFSQSNIVSLHCPLTADTLHLVDERRLSLMQHDAILINTGRGPLVDDIALIHALNEGRLAAYGADVLTKEPAETDNPLIHATNAFFTPHIAWATTEARQRLVNICAANLRAFIEGKPLNQVK